MTKHYKIFLYCLLFIFINVTGCTKSEYSTDKESKLADNSIDFTQIKTDSLFNSSQIISILTIPTNSLDKYDIIFSHSNLDFKTTSSFGKSAKAIAAINGGFFNMDSGGSATYFEIDDILIANTRNPELKWGIRKDLMNGAIVIDNESTIHIQRANSDDYYKLSKMEDAVLVTGPLLIIKSELMEFPNLKFVNNRHPRTCIGITNDSIKFITIDGRSKKAQGMSLPELQQYLQSIGCVDAINLDGGGSTTMWIYDKGVVNFPSDKLGERPVSNAILVVNE